MTKAPRPSNTPVNPRLSHVARPGTSQCESPCGAQGRSRFPHGRHSLALFLCSCRRAWCCVRVAGAVRRRLTPLSPPVSLHPTRPRRSGQVRSAFWLLYECSSHSPSASASVFRLCESLRLASRSICNPVYSVRRIPFPPTAETYRTRTGLLSLSQPLPLLSTDTRSSHRPPRLVSRLLSSPLALILASCLYSRSMR